MKKRIISLLLVFCLLGTLLSACKKGGSVNAQDLITKAAEKTATLQDIDLTLDIQIEVSVQGVNVSIPANLSLKLKDAATGNPQLYASVNASAVGQTIDCELYWDGDWAYIEYNGEGFKISTEDFDPEDIFAGSSGNTGSSSDDLGINTQDLLKDAAVTNNSDGSQSVTILIPGTLFDELYDTILGGMSSSANMNPGDLKIKDTTMTVTVKDEYLVGYNIETAMDATVEGQSMSFSMKFDLKLNNPGQTVTITPPSGYQNYPEFDLDNVQLPEMY